MKGTHFSAAPQNYPPESHPCSFDLLFSPIRCGSVNESLCCSASAPYLAIIALITGIKPIYTYQRHGRPRGAALVSFVLPSADLALRLIGRAVILSLPLPFM